MIINICTKRHLIIYKKIMLEDVKTSLPQVLYPHIVVYKAGDQ